MSKQKSSELLKVLGVVFGVAIIVGNSVGIGILKMPATVAHYVPDANFAILLWIIFGFFALIGSLVYAEAATLFPQAGGPYVFAEKVFGEQIGFSIGFCDWLQNVISLAFLAIPTAEYTIGLTGWDIPISLLASLIILTLSVPQWFGIRASSTIQKSMSLLKGGGLLVLVALFFLNKQELTHSTPAFIHNASEGSVFTAVILAGRAIYFTYFGWNAPVYFTEEDKDPVKNIPRSMVYGVIALTVIYVLVNASINSVLPADIIAKSSLPVADAVKLIFGGTGSTLVTLLMIIILTGIMYASMLYTPRILFGMARSGMFFDFASRTNVFKIPGNALVLTATIAIVLAFTGTFNMLTSIMALIAMVIDTSVYAAVLCNKKRNTQTNFFKVPLFPFTPVFMLLINLAFVVGVIYEDCVNSAYAVVLLLLTVPLHYLLKRKK